MASQPKRSSQLIATALLPAKPPCVINPKAVISEKAALLGTHKITIGPDTVIHPYAKLDATHGPIELGAYCIVAERAIVGLTSAAPDPAAVTIGDYVSIETGATVEASQVGKATVIGAYSTLQPGCVIGMVVINGSNVDQV